MLQIAPSIGIPRKKGKPGSSVEIEKEEGDKGRRGPETCYNNPLQRRGRKSSSFRRGIRE